MQVVQDGAADWLTLDRPDQLNALNDLMIEELSAYFSALQSDHSRRVVVLRGAGRAFCAGLDLKSFRAHGSGDAGAPDEKPRPYLPDLILKMRSCPQPIVALVHGAACGGGFSLALAADIRIAGHSARMNLAFVKLGVSGCELGSSYFLPRMVGLSVASELMMTGRFIGADRALRTGLVSEATDDADLESAARTLVTDLLRTSPTGLRKTKETLNLAMKLNELGAIIEIEQHTQLMCMNSPNFDEAVSAFNQKREPIFVGV
ncbi:enoyl-CoA hydratase [Sphingomonas sp. Root50]|nr:enoyl-CoA hydratase [Sphingomonas sp. Root1294]KQY72370.1 enoyl-CoA hydratase [Sphingomonas sp. Root50]KRB95489.1 enoyl-CoA hydratase [Sphingomonas sp. Root720]